MASCMHRRPPSTAPLNRQSDRRSFFKCQLLLPQPANTPPTGPSVWASGPSSRGPSPPTWGTWRPTRSAACPPRRAATDLRAPTSRTRKVSTPSFSKIMLPEETSSERSSWRFDAEFAERFSFESDFLSATRPFRTEQKLDLIKCGKIQREFFLFAD